MIRGATLATGSAGAELLVLDGVSSDSGIAAIRSAVAACLDGCPSVDGLIVGAPLAAMAAVAGFEARGLTVGRDFDVVAKDAVPFLTLFRAPIMTVEEDVSRAGDFLARAAVHAIEHPDASPMQFLDVPV
jgi:LacI family transcriptional regulator